SEQRVDEEGQPAVQHCAPPPPTEPDASRAWGITSGEENGSTKREAAVTNSHPARGILTAGARCYDAWDGDCRAPADPRLADRVGGGEDQGPDGRGARGRGVGPAHRRPGW